MGDLPNWVQALAAVTLGVGVLTAFTLKVLLPIYRLAKTLDTTVPHMVKLAEMLETTPRAQEVLKDILASVPPLMEMVKRLDEAARVAGDQALVVQEWVVDARHASELLKVGVETARVLSERDREQLQRLLILLDRLTIKVDGGAEALGRIEVDRAHVAADLNASHRRADMVSDTVPGAAADAAARSIWDGKERRQINAAPYDGPERRTP